mgnify:CR=1 FL=1
MIAQQLEQALNCMSPFIKKTGIRITELEPGAGVLELSFNQDNLNHLGTFHAGAIFGLGETAGGVALLSRENLAAYKMVAKSAKIAYRKPIAKLATASASLSEEAAGELARKVEEAGRATIVLDILIRNENGEDAAEMSVEYHLRKV